MPWTTPTLKDVRKMTRDYVTAFLGTKVIVPNSPLRIMSDAMSGLAHLTLLYIDWLAKQFLPDTAETEWLDRHGNIWLKNADGSKGRKLATYAMGTVTLTATIKGTILPSGSRLTGAIDYQTTEEIAVNLTPTPVSVVALTTGLIGNLDANDILTLVDTINGINNTAVVVTMDGGIEAESDDDLRARVLYRIQNPPMGGDKSDYVIWTLAVSGVTRAWCYPLEMGIGTVTIRFMCDDLRADNNGIPEFDDIVAVTNYLDIVRPVAVKDRFIEPPIPFYYDLIISDLTDDSPSVRARIDTAIKTMERQRLFPGCTLYRSWIDEAISGAIGEDHHELTFDTIVMPSPGHLPVLNTITYA